MALVSTVEGWTTAFTTHQVLFFLFVLLCLHLICYTLYGPLSDVPNIHWLAPWSSYYNLYVKYFHSVRERHYQAHINASGRDFRPIIRVGPNEVSIMSSDGVKAVWGAGFERPPWYDVFHNFGYAVLYPQGFRS